MMPDPTTPILIAAGVLGVFVTGALVGFVGGRRASRQELAAATAQIAMFNSSEAREALAEVGPITGGNRVVELFDQDAPATLPRVVPDPWQPAAKGTLR